MMKWPVLVAIIASIPLASPPAAAQEVKQDHKAERPSDEGSGNPRARITEARARDIALATVGRDLQSGSIAPWKGKAPSGLKVVSASQSNLGGRAAYIVAVQMMKSTGIVRLTLDAKDGALLDRQIGSTWDWGNAPAWWKAGLNSPPPAKAK